MSQMYSVPVTSGTPPVFTTNVSHLTAPVVDYVHGNSMEQDVDGNILISARHLNEITKIDRQTGDIVWRMGGRHNEFTLIGDTEFFTRQHSARRTPTGTLTP